MSGLTETLAKMRQGFERIPQGVKIMLFMCMAIGLAASIYAWATHYAANSKYEPLYSRLDSRDASEIVQKLSQRKVPYKISSDGSSVLVPANLVHTTRLSLAGEGLPRGGAVGFELLDKISFGATDFDRRVNYVRALTGELTRTIREIDGVEDARVHITLPETSYFIAKSKPATAAVFLRLRPMFEISRLQVKGIVHLVSRSVEGLKPEDVVVIDLYGRLLSGDISGADGRPDDRRQGANWEIQQSFQKELEMSLKALLERVLGHGNVEAMVSAELDFDQRTVDRIQFQPAATEGVVRSIQELHETFKGSGVVPSGVPGVTSNIPQYQTQSTGQSDWQRRETTKNFEINEIKERTVVAPGSVKRLSVAVVVNKVLDEASRQAIEKTVSAAIGYDAARKDTVTVTGIAFDTSLMDAIRKQMEDEKKAAETGRPSLWRNVAIGSGAAVLLSLLLILAARRGRSPTRVPAAARGRLDVTDAIATAAQVAAAQDTDERVHNPEAERRRRSRDEIEQVARQHPENVAKLIRTWLHEERR